VCDAFMKDGVKWIQVENGHWLPVVRGDGHICLKAMPGTGLAGATAKGPACGAGHTMVVSTYAGPGCGARFFDRSLYPRMPLSFTPLLPLEALPCVWPMTFFSGVHCLLPVRSVNRVRALKVWQRVRMR
jgi:hypothetical protein